MPSIVEKTGCTTRAVKHTIGQTRTALLSAITAYGQAPAYAVQQEKSHKFSLKDTPWLYILFQNYIGKVTGIAHVGITGSAAGAIAMVGQAGGVAGTSVVIGQAGGIAGNAAGQAGSAAGAAVTRQAELQVQQRKHPHMGLQNSLVRLVEKWRLESSELLPL